MPTTTTTTMFGYRVSVLHDVARLDVQGDVTEEHVGTVIEAIDRLVTGGCTGLVLGLSRARLGRRDVARLRAYAYAALSRERVMVEAPVPAAAPPLEATA